MSDEEFDRTLGTAIDEIYAGVDGEGAGLAAPTLEGEGESIVARRDRRPARACRGGRRPGSACRRSPPPARRESVRGPSALPLISARMRTRPAHTQRTIAGQRLSSITSSGRTRQPVDDWRVRPMARSAALAIVPAAATVAQAASASSAARMNVLHWTAGCGSANERPMNDSDDDFAILPAAAAQRAVQALSDQPAGGRRRVSRPA